MNPEKFTTLIDMLAYRAEVSASKAACTFNGSACTFEELWRGVNRFADLLQKLGVKSHECVVIAIPNSKEFFFAFYGVQRTGGIAVPIFPGSVFTAGSPQRLFNAFAFNAQGASYDVHPDGKRFLMTRAAGAVALQRDELVVVQDFFEELRRKAPE